MLIQALFLRSNLRASRYHSLLWHLNVKKTVLRQLSPTKIAPNHNLNPNSNLNLKPKGWGAVFLGDNCLDTKKKQTLIKKHNNNIAFIGTTLLWNPNHYLPVKMKDLINNWDQLSLRKGHFFSLSDMIITLMWLLSCFVDVIICFFCLLCVITNPVYSFHHTNLLK